MKLFPNYPDVSHLYSVIPWWSVLHYIVQAGAVIAMEILLRFVHVSSVREQIVEDAGKVLKWLKTMSITSTSAFRA